MQQQQQHQHSKCDWNFVLISSFCLGSTRGGGRALRSLNHQVFVLPAYFIDDAHRPFDGSVQWLKWLVVVVVGHDQVLSSFLSDFDDDDGDDDDDDSYDDTRGAIWN